MFDSLSGKLQNAFRNLRGLGKISESNASEALREVRLALLEADVNFKVARDFIERVKVKALGQEVVQSIQPGQQIVKIIHDEMVELLGSANAGLQLSGNPSCVLMIGLHGSGKTTSSGKLGRLLHKQGRTPLLVAADVYRPAAMEQLETLGKQLDLPVYLHKGETDVLKIAREALAFAKANNRNTLIFDTAGRLQIDEALVQELVRLRDLIKPQETLLVLDAATGQEAVNVATHFDQALNITGSILTKLDGDARGGAALTQVAVWLIAGTVVFQIAKQRFEFLQSAHIDFGFIILALVLSILQYLLYGSFMAAIGSVVLDAKQGQSWSSPVILAGMTPLFFFGVIIFDPNGALAVILSLFPLTAPLALLLRYGMTSIPAWQIIVSLALITLSIIGAMWMASKVFRFGILRYGQGIKLSELAAKIKF